MKIVRASAAPLNVPVTVDILGLNKETTLSPCLTEIETDTGLVGHDMTAITEEEIIAAAVREVAGPAHGPDVPGRICPKRWASRS